MSLKLGILGLLAEEPLHGYEVKSRFEAMLGNTWEVNIGQIYSTLQRLERDDLVEPAGDRGDRGKLAYKLTPLGRQSLDRWLSEPEAEPQQLHDDLFVKLALIRRLGNGNLQGLIDRQRRGEVQVDGVRVHRLGEAAPARYRRAKLGFVFQFFNLLDRLTVLDNILLPAQLVGLKSQVAQERAHNLLGQLGIAEKAKA